ncbi:MAG: hypothetical protein GQ531_08805 [Sulfurovum sp.]|nr:hypothetical protein [Sulfurovum sp.]
MKTKQLKALTTVLAFSTLLAFTGCDEEGLPSEYQLVGGNSLAVASQGLTQASDPVLLTTPPPSATCEEATEAEYGTIEFRIDENLTQVWLAKNLGASRIATDFNDTEAYGDRYQWGRATDGHEKRDSNITLTQADIIEVEHGEFIINRLILEQLPQIHILSFDWVEPSVDDNGSLRTEGWSNEETSTQVCPCGYVVPSLNDFFILGNATNGTFPQDLKLVFSGTRNFQSGEDEIHTYPFGYYWTRDRPSFSGAYLVDIFDDAGIEIRLNIGNRANGNAIRCIRQDTSNYDTPIQIDN